MRHTARYWNRRNRALLLENIEMYISAGLTLQRALHVVVPTFSVKQARAIDAIQTHVEQGHLLSAGLRDHIGLSPALAGLIEQGERSGSLPASLSLARAMIEREDVLIKTCISSLTYPIVIALFACVLTFGLMRGVMPQIIPLLKSLQVTLPLITQIVMYMSEHVIDYGFYVCCVICVSIFVSIFLYRKSALYKLCCHVCIMSIPLVGSLFRQYSLSLMMRSLGSLITSGLDVSKAYAFAIDRIPLLPLRNSFSKNITAISQGTSLGSIFQMVKHIPSYIVPLISAGETSGTLGISLVRAADIIDRDIEHALKRITSLIEPVMMVGMGCIIGTIALSIMMPIYDVSKTLQH